MTRMTLPSREIKAIPEFGGSRYWMNVKYGPNTLSWFGNYAYIWWEMGGDEIKDGAIVAPWANIGDVTYDYIFNGNQTGTHTADGDFETVECAVVFKRDRGILEYAPYE